MLATAMEPECNKELGQGILEARKVTSLPFFFNLKVSATVQIEDLLIPGLRRSTSAPAVRLVPVHGLHIGKTHANKPLKLLVQDPGDFLSKAQGGYGHREAFVFTHDERAGEPLYTLNICVKHALTVHTLLSSSRSCPDISQWY